MSATNGICIPRYERWHCFNVPHYSRAVAVLLSQTASIVRKPEVAVSCIAMFALSFPLTGPFYIICWIIKAGKAQSTMHGFHCTSPPFHSKACLCRSLVLVQVLQMPFKSRFLERPDEHSGMQTDMVADFWFSWNVYKQLHVSQCLLIFNINLPCWER